jgi:hypothetical protein
MSEWKERTVAVIVVLAFISLFTWLIPVAVEKNEVIECLKLRAYSEQFSEFYLTASESEMCLSHMIVIDARVSE